MTMPAWVTDWPENRRGDAWEGPPPGRNGTHKPRLIVAGESETEPEAPPLPLISAGELMRTYPERRPAVIDGLLRVGETMNVIAPSKTGKSWLTVSLAFAVHTGRPWLSFETRQGRVLVIDNELHRETIAHRLRTLAGALNWPTGDIAGIDFMPLRGRLENLYGLANYLGETERGRYTLVIIDAWYRTLPVGADENDNASMAGLYNRLDCVADALGASFALVHHASKGDQSAKSVTDVGSGAGAQARATDTHLILRPHEEDNAVVLDAAVRSWPPVNPLCLRWEFPRWIAAPELDPTALRLPKPRRRKAEGEEVTPKAKEPPWTARRFADAFGKPEPRARAAILESARLLGLSDRKANELLKGAVECGYLFSWKEAGAASRTLIATVKPVPGPTGRREPGQK